MTIGFSEIQYHYYLLAFLYKIYKILSLFTKYSDHDDDVYLRDLFINQYSQ